MAVKQATPKQVRRMILLFSLIPLLFICIGMHLLIKGYKSYSWLQGTATVLESRIETGRKSDGDNSYSVKVNYEYNIDGKIYKSTNLSTGAHPYNSADWHDVEDYRQTMEVGAEIIMYYNPQQPGESAIIRGIQLSTYLFILIPLFVLLVFKNMWPKYS